MSRRPSLNPKRPITMYLPPELLDRVEEELYSELEGRVPHGKYSEFFSELLRKHFNETELDLAPYLGKLPGEVTVRGDKFSLALLIKKLEKV